MEFRNRRRQRGATDVNLTPLLDVVFNLLIFFLITTTFVQNAGIEVELPKASSAPPSEETESVVVAITADGEFVHEGTAVSLEQLKTRLENHKKQRSNALVIIQADTKTNHGFVVQAMDTARGVGFTQLAIATDAQ